jgi:hypothetical protein
MIAGTQAFSNNFVMPDSGAMEIITPGLVRQFGADAESKIFKPQSGGTISHLTPEQIEAKKKGLVITKQEKAE